MKILNWHRFVFRMLKRILKPYLVKKLNYSFEEVKPKHKPYIILANHNTDYDPFLVGLAFPIKCIMWQVSIYSDGAL